MKIRRIVLGVDLSFPRDQALYRAGRARQAGTAWKLVLVSRRKAERCAVEGATNEISNTSAKSPPQCAQKRRIGLTDASCDPGGAP